MTGARRADRSIPRPGTVPRGALPPTAGDRHAHHASGRRRARRRRAGSAAPSAPVAAADAPSWWVDARGFIANALVSLGFFTACILLARWGVLVGRRGEVGDPQWMAAGVVGLSAYGLARLQVSRSRWDRGFRRTGLVPLLIGGVLFAVCAQSVSMLMWPFLIGMQMISDTVLATMGEDPLALVTAVFFSLLVYASMVAVAMLLAARSAAADLIGHCLLLVLCVAAVLGAQAVLVVPPSAVVAVICMLAGIAALIVLAGAAGVLGLVRRNDGAVKMSVH